MWAILDPPLSWQYPTTGGRNAKNAGSHTVPLLLAIIIPVLSAAVIPWVLFAAVPIQQDTYYEFPLAELGATFVAALLSVGLAAWAVMRSGGRRPVLWHVLVALVSGVVSVTTLWFGAWVIVITRLQGMLALWAALLVLWVVLLLRSLKPAGKQPTNDRALRQETMGT